MSSFGIKTGIPHFEGVVKQSRSSTYTLGRCLNEFIDNIIYKCSRIKIRTIIEPNSKKILKILISDDYHEGFENVHEEGVNNPFNFTHKREGHNDDDETSQFGIGMKSAGIACAENMKVFTRVKERYHQVIFDVIEMSGRENPEESFNPSMFEISKANFKAIHPFDFGSTIILEHIRPEIADLMGPTQIEKLRNELSETYGEIVRTTDIHLEVDGVRIIPNTNYFTEPSCKGYMKISRIYILEKEITTKDGIKKPEISYFVEEKFEKNLKYYSFNKDTERFNQMKISSVPAVKENEKYVGSFNPEKCYAIELTGTTTINHPNSSKKLAEGIQFVPKGRTMVYRNGRCYGILPQPAKSAIDGYCNYSENKIEIASKKILTTAGLSWNKIFRNEDDNNELLNVINGCLQRMKNESRKIYKSSIEKADKKPVPEEQPDTDDEPTISMEEVMKKLPHPKKRVIDDVSKPGKADSSSILEQISKVVTNPETPIKKTTPIPNPVSREVPPVIPVVKPNPVVVSVTPSEPFEKTLLKAEEGLKIIKNMIDKKQELSVERIKILHEIICDYMDNCAPRQLEIIFKNISSQEKMKILYDLVKEKYSNESKQNMVAGKKLCEISN